MLSSVGTDGVVTLRNSHGVLAKIRVDDNEHVEELDFDPREEEASESKEEICGQDDTVGSPTAHSTIPRILRRRIYAARRSS
jgi:hypothetical protein